MRKESVRPMNEDDVIWLRIVDQETGALMLTDDAMELIGGPGVSAEDVRQALDGGIPIPPPMLRRLGEATAAKLGGLDPLQFLRYWAIKDHCQALILDDFGQAWITR